MRTTIRLPDDLLRSAKARAAQAGTTLTSVIEDALRAFLAARDSDESMSVHLPTVGGDGVQPGVDLDDSAALLAHMESFADPA